MENIKIMLVDLIEISGLTTYYFDDDGVGYYTIFINAQLSSDMQCAVYDHEMSHINNGDFDSMIAADALEELRHAG